MRDVERRSVGRRLVNGNMIGKSKRKAELVGRVGEVSTWDTRPE